jgi:alanine dehydrogenase
MVAEVFVRGRSDAALDKLISDFAGRTSFKLKPVLDNSSLSHCDVVITATNARTPLFEDDELDPGAITIHLGGNEAPEAYLQRALRTGLVVCDDIKTVSRRNSQSIALHFSKRTLSLEEIGPLIGIRELSAPIAFEIDPTAPVCVTCVGLPMLDLYVAQATYEKYLALKVKG